MSRKKPPRRCPHCGSKRLFGKIVNLNGRPRSRSLYDETPLPLLAERLGIEHSELLLLHKYDEPFLNKILKEL
jgi:hypothetical protein